MDTIDRVRAYWDAHPLASHEVPDPGSPAFFDALDKLKREDLDRFAFPYWSFDGYAGKAVLDIGCGPGWLTVQYALGGARVAAVDLTPRAVELTRQHLDHRGTEAAVREGNAESLPFEDNHFDLVVASGVLHHTPDWRRAFAEAFRVTRPGGEGRITLYRRGWLHRPGMFRLTRLAMQWAGVRHPGADLGRTAVDVEDFIRRYDGDENPVGIAFTDAQWAAELVRCGWQEESREVHFFPRRFVSFSERISGRLHRFLDRHAGTMVYFRLRKPD